MGKLSFESSEQPTNEQSTKRRGLKSVGRASEREIRGVRGLGCQSHHISAMLAIRSGFLVPYESPEYALSNEV